MASSVVLLVLISALMHASWNYISKSQTSSAAFFAIATASTVVAMIPLYIHFVPWYSTVPYEVWAFLLATGFCMGAYYVCLARAYTMNDISFVYPITRSLPVLLVPIVCIVLGYGEPLKLQAIIGMIVIAIGCFVLPLSAMKTATLKAYWHPSLPFVLIAALGTTGYTVVDSNAMTLLKSARPHAGIEVALFYTAFQSLSVTLFLAIYVACSKENRKQLQLLRSTIRYPIFSGLTCTAAYTLILIAMQHATNVSYITALRQISIVIGVLLGIFALKESATLSKIVGVMLIVVGLVLAVLK